MLEKEIDTEISKVPLTAAIIYNSMIARFMGAVVKGEKHNEVFFLPGGVCGRTVHELKYDKSWDWLLPAVRKAKGTVAGTTDDSSKLVAKIDRAVLEGDRFACWYALVDLVTWFTETGIQSKPVLTEREVVIIQMICDEKGSRQIAENIGIGARAVDKIKRELLKKVKVKSIAGLVKYAILNGVCYPFINHQNNNQ